MKCRYWVAFISHFRYFLKKAYFQSLPYYFCKLITWKNSRKSDLWFSFNMRRKMDYFDMSLQWGNFLFILVITLGSFSCSFSQAVAADSNLSIPIPVLESRCILKTWQRLSCGIFALCYVTTCTSRKWRERGSIVMTDNLLNP